MKLWDRITSPHSTALLNFYAICGLLTMWFVMLFIGMIGIHNFDQSQNLRWINAEFDLALVDYATPTKYFTPREGYILGVEQLFLAYSFMSFCSLAALVLFFFLTLDKYREEYNKSRKNTGEPPSQN